MKKFLTGIVSAALCAVIAVSVCGCGTPSASNPSTSSPLTTSVVEPSSNGTHKVVMTDTGKKLVENGVTAYKIIAPDGGDLNENTAVSEFTYFMKRATGADFDTASATQYNENDKFIVIGKNAYATSAGIEYDRNELKSTGTRIVTKGNSVFIGGAETKGTLNAVYEFLSRTVGFEIYTKDVIVINESATVPLYAYDITEVPDFEFRQLGYGSVNNDELYFSRMRGDHAEQVFATVKTSLWHNSFEIVDKNTYGENLDWYSNDGKQLCYTAHGNKAEYDKLQKVVFEAIKKTAIEKPTINNIPLSIEDNGSWCDCDTCAAEKAKYGTDAAVHIKFCNDIAEKLDNWVKTNDDGVPHDRPLKLTMFAYYATNDAPVTKNADGTYSPIDESVVCRDNVNVLYAPIQAMFNQRIDAPINAAYYEPFKQWSAICNELALWVYSTNFNNYLYPYNSWDVIQDNYRIYNDYNVMYLFDQGQMNNMRSTAFSELKCFLTSKLSWNVNEDVAKLTNDYFEHVYGPAAGTMREMYDSVRMYMKYLENEKNVTGAIGFAIASTEYFPKHTLDKFLEFTDKAMGEIAPLAVTDPDLYEVYKDKIVLESLFPRFALYDKYSGYHSTELFAELKAQFKADLQQCGITNYKEFYGDIYPYLEGWS